MNEDNRYPEVMTNGRDWKSRKASRSCARRTTRALAGGGSRAQSTS
jgi:hypothetical protein